MADARKPDVPETEEKALEGISVSPPVPSPDESDVGRSAHAVPEIREGKDADDDDTLKNDPSNADAKLDVALDETFPTSDAPSNTRPGSSGEPAPSSGFDEEAEAERADR